MYTYISQFEAPPLLESIGAEAFTGTKLEQFTAPQKLKTIGNNAFSNCKDLRLVVLNEGLTVLDTKDDSYDYYGQNYASSSIFCGSGLKEVVWPSTLKSIDRDTFSECYSLKAVWVEDGCPENIRSAVGDHVGILRKSTKVGDQLLWDLRKLNELVIPDGTKLIGKHWFCGCGVNSVTIPPSVKEIEERAFCDCYNLTTIVF